MQVRTPAAMMSFVGAPDQPAATQTGPGKRTIEYSYDAFPRIEESFHAALDESLHPRGTELLYDLVRDMGLPAGSLAVDVGCGDGRHSVQLAERFQFTVTGLDPVPRQIEVANASLVSLDLELAGRVRFELGAAEALPLEDGTLDLVWCRDVLVHVANLDRAYAEFQRVLRSNGRVLVYQMFAGDRLEPREAESLWRMTGVVQTSAERARTDAAISAAGLRVDECIDVSEWGDWAQEQSGKGGQRLLYAARLLRDPQRYITRFGQTAYEIMLGDCLWHVYGMIGKLERTVYLLSKA
jgi:SAM-dependent methyltransferase